MGYYWASPHQFQREIAIGRSRCCHVARSRPFSSSFAPLPVDFDMCDTIHEYCGFFFGARCNVSFAHALDRRIMQSDRHVARVLWPTLNLLIIRISGVGRRLEMDIEHLYPNPAVIICRCTCECIHRCMCTYACSQQQQQQIWGCPKYVLAIWK